MTDTSVSNKCRDIDTVTLKIRYEYLYLILSVAPNKIAYVPENIRSLHTI